MLVVLGTVPRTVPCTGQLFDQKPDSVMGDSEKRVRGQNGGEAKRGCSKMCVRSTFLHSVEKISYQF